MMGQIWEIKNENILCVKGAYESVLPLCNINSKDKVKILDKVGEYSRLGYRVLAIAKKII